MLRQQKAAKDIMLDHFKTVIEARNLCDTARQLRETSRRMLAEGGLLKAISRRQRAEIKLLMKLPSPDDNGHAPARSPQDPRSRNH